MPSLSGYFFCCISIQQCLTSLVAPALSYGFGTTLPSEMTSVATPREWQGISLIAPSFYEPTQYLM